MQNIFIDVLPPWVETGLQPAFYDLESGTVLQQTARMYAKVRELTEAFNTFTTNVTNEITQFEQDTNDEIERFEQATNDEIERFEGVINDTVEEYIQKFNDLHDYVEDYFENLDVQEEINNKLDDMVEQGTLQEIITTYIQANVKWTFDTVSDMQSATNLVEGSYATTLGFYVIGDGGGATYKIKDSTDVTTNGMDKIAIGDNLYAELVIPNNDTISIRQLGAKCYEDNSTAFDCHDYFARFVSIKHDAGKQLTLYIPSGRWATTPLLITEDNISIKGNESFMYDNTLCSAIIPYQDNQSFVIKLGGFADFSVAETNPTINITIKNIVFTAMYGDTTTDWYHVNNGLLCLDYCLYSFFDNIFFQKFDGQGLYIRSCWENYFGVMNFRTKTDPSKPCILMDTVASFITGANISALDFENLMFEGIDGTMIKSMPNSSFAHSNFNNINIEYTTGTRDSHRQTMTAAEDVSSYIEMAMFDGRAEYVTFNNINFATQNDFKLVFDDDTYYLSSLFRNAQDTITDATLFPQSITVNSIIFKTFADCHTRVALSRNSYGAISSLLIGNLIYPNRPSIKLFNFDNGSIVKIANLNNGQQPANTFIPMYSCTAASNNRGVLTSDYAASNDLKLVYKKPSVGMNSTTMTINDGSFYYPYNNTDTIKFRINLRSENGVTYRVILRGTLNGAAKDYDITGTGDGYYHILESDIAFDANSIVNIVESTSQANAYIDWFSMVA